MDIFTLNAKLKAIEALATERRDTGGLLKRIDENRELMQVLQRDAPEFLESHPWVTRWIKANDSFFCSLDKLVKPPTHGKGFRPWPGPTPDDEPEDAA